MRALVTVTRLRVFVAFVLLTLAGTAFPALSARPAKSDSRPHPKNSVKLASKLDVELQRARSARLQGTVRVIVKPAAGRHAAAVQKRRAHGDAIRSEHAIVDAFSATIHADDLDALESDPDVASVSLDADVTSDALIDAPGEAATSALT